MCLLLAPLLFLESLCDGCGISLKVSNWSSFNFGFIFREVGNDAGNLPSGLDRDWRWRCVGAAKNLLHSKSAVCADTSGVSFIAEQPINDLKTWRSCSCSHSLLWGSECSDPGIDPSLKILIVFEVCLDGEVSDWTTREWSKISSWMCRETNFLIGAHAVKKSNKKVLSFLHISIQWPSSGLLAGQCDTPDLQHTWLYHSPCSTPSCSRHRACLITFWFLSCTHCSWARCSSGPERPGWSSSCCPSRWHSPRGHTLMRWAPEWTWRNSTAAGCRCSHRSSAADLNKSQKNSTEHCRNVLIYFPLRSQ